MDNNTNMTAAEAVERAERIRRIKGKHTLVLIELVTERKARWVCACGTEGVGTSWARYVDVRERAGINHKSHARRALVKALAED